MIGQCNGLGECTDFVRRFPVGSSVVSFDSPIATNAFCLRPTVVCAIALAIGEQLLAGDGNGADSGLKLPDVVHVEAVLSQRAAGPCVDRPECAAYPVPSCSATDSISRPDGIFSIAIEEKHLRFPIVTGVLIRGIQMSFRQGSIRFFHRVREIGEAVLKHEAEFVLLTSGLDEAEQLGISIVAG